MLGEDKTLLNDSFDVSLLPAEFSGPNDSYSGTDWTNTMMSYTHTTTQ